MALFHEDNRFSTSACKTDRLERNRSLAGCNDVEALGDSGKIFRTNLGLHMRRVGRFFWPFTTSPVFEWSFSIDLFKDKFAELSMGKLLLLFFTLLSVEKPVGELVTLDTNESTNAMCAVSESNTSPIVATESGELFVRVTSLSDGNDFKVCPSTENIIFMAILFN